MIHNNYDLYKNYGQIINGMNKKGFTERTLSDAINMLRDIFGIFTHNGIDIWLTMGSLLGATRESAMIPWIPNINVSVMTKIIKCNEDTKGILDTISESENFLWEKISNNFIEVDIHDMVLDKTVFMKMFPSMNHKKKWIGLSKENKKWHKRSFCFLHKDFGSIHPELFDSVILGDGSNRLNFRPNSHSIHLYQMMIDENGFVNYACDVNSKGRRHYYIKALYDDIFPLEMISFCGRSFKAPCKKEKVLFDNYGNSWKEAIKGLHGGVSEGVVASHTTDIGLKEWLLLESNYE